MRRVLSLMALSMAFLQATVQGAAPTNELTQVTAWNNEKMDHKDRWSGRSELTGLNSTHIKSIDTAGLSMTLTDGDNVAQDTVTFTAAECKLLGKAGTSVTCNKKGVGSVSLKPFTVGTTTSNKNNKARSLGSSTHTDKHNSTANKIFHTDLDEFHKVQWKFSNRQFTEDELVTPLKVTITPPPPLGPIVASLPNDDCTTKEGTWGTQKLACKA